MNGGMMDIVPGLAVVLGLLSRTLRGWRAGSWGSRLVLWFCHRHRRDWTAFQGNLRPWKDSLGRARLPFTRGQHGPHPHWTRESLEPASSTQPLTESND